MRRRLLTLLAIATIGVTACSDGDDVTQPATTRQANVQELELIPGQYVVVLKSNGAEVASKAKEKADKHNAKLKFVYSHSIKGFAVTDMTADEAEKLRKDSEVAYVEQDQVVRAFQVQPNPPSWGLDRIDQRPLPLDNNYTYNQTGAGVRAYIIDTGIFIGHNDFGGRASHGFDAIGDGQNGNDCNGHGTHVAGTVGGTAHGVAKGVALITVRVLNCSGSGSFSQVIAGVDWVTNNRVLPAVANMSLGGGAFQALDDAVTASINAGVAYSIAAGNSNANACNYSPARTPRAMTIGSSTISDVRSSFSNWGSCVDWFAPGSSITSAWIGAPNAINTISGTSMAAPHTAGVAALYLQVNPGATPDQVTTALLGLATKNVILDPVGSPPHMVYSLIDGVPVNLPPNAQFAHSCNYLDCSFTDQSTDSDGTVTQRAWDFGDGQTSNAQNPVHTYGAAGTFVVKLTVTDDDGATGTIQKSITVEAPPNQPPSAAFTETCSGLTCNFTDQSTDPDNNIAAWEWTFGDGGSSTAKNPSRTYAAAGTYLVTLKVFDTFGMTSTTSHGVTVGPPPPPPITLTVVKRTRGKTRYADLSWSGATGPTVDIYRNNALLLNTANDGAHTDNLGKTSGTFSYKVCLAGNAGACSNTVSVTF